MTTRYFLFISYKGTFYHGWQLQPGSITVQQVVEETLSTILGEKISVTGAGRTDTGVHASLFCLHFDSSSGSLHKDHRIMHRINGLLPNDISAGSIRKVLPDAHARYSAISRTYHYYISRSKDPFSQDSSWYVYGDLDIISMREACRILLEKSDFTSFSRLHSDTKTNICRIYEADWIEGPGKLIFNIRADRFLRNMVRAITGTMIDIGRKKTTLDEFRMIIDSKNRSMAGQSAPAKGLFLVGIEYPDKIFT